MVPEFLHRSWIPDDALKPIYLQEALIDQVINAIGEAALQGNMRQHL
jgi:hypothetical protein